MQGKIIPIFGRIPGESEPEFEAILDRVDPNRDMFISLQDYMGFMISKETENVATSDEIVNAFQAITTQEREYIHKKELYAHLSKEMADYCSARMKPYVDPKTGQSITGEAPSSCIESPSNFIIFQVLWTTWNSPRDCSPKHLLL